MEHQAGVKPSFRGRLDGLAILGFLLPFSIVVYLALRGGGYDPIVRGEFGVVVWWVVLLGAVAGVLTTAGWDRPTWATVGLFAAFAVWTGIGIVWTQSSERTVLELARVAAYGGVLVLGLTAGTRAGLKRSVAGVASGLALVSVLALASRLHPQWFPENEAADVLPETIKRLNYPVGYWNGLAAIVAIGIPLVLWMATDARRIAVRAIAAAVIPAMVLTAYLTISRGGALEIAVALGAFIALHPRRIGLLPTLLTVSAGGFALAWAASRREDLANGLATAAANSQADEMILITLVVCLVTGLVQWGIAEASERGIGPRPRISRRASLGLLGLAAASALIVGLAAGGPDRLSTAWDEFKAPTGPESGDTIERFSSASGNGRYQYWSTAVDAGRDEPIMGVGAGTWEFEWARDGTLDGFVRNAHSLYLESFAELGLLGLLLIAGFMALVLGVGIQRALTADAERRPVLVGATAACAAFVTAAAVDWSWQLPVIPVAFLLVAAAAVTADRLVPEAPRTLLGRAPLAVVALVAAVAVALPLPAAISIRSSQDSVNAGDLPQALDQAETAEGWQPYAAAPRLQRALVLERAGQLEAARTAAEEAVHRESVNWRNWFVLSRIEAALGHASRSRAAFERARELNPRSPLFAS